MGFKKALGEILWFELIWKLAVLCFANPLLREIYQSYVASVGVSFNGNMLEMFLNLKGALLFLVLFFCAALLIFYEYSVVISIAALCRQGEAHTLGQVLRRSLWDLGVMRGWSLAAGSLYYILLLPLVCIGYFNTLVPQVTVPWFIYGEMEKTSLGTAGILAIYIAYHSVYLLLLFVPPCMVLGRQRFWPAVKNSLRCWKAAGWKIRLALLALILFLGEGVFGQIARYWRRTRLGNNDFDGYFFRYLVYSEAFRKDLAFWILITLLQTVSMAVFLYVLVSVIPGRRRLSLRPGWSGDGAVLMGILDRRWAACRTRWLRRFRTWPWRLGAAAFCLLLVLQAAPTLSLPLLAHGPLAIGHRGSCYAVENTLDAILAAEEHGADYAEIDIQLTADGVPVLFHDGNLLRMADRWEGVEDMTWAQLQKLPLSDYRHPDAQARFASLEEVLTALKPSAMGLLIELKPTAGREEALAAAVIEAVEKHGFGNQAMFMSLDYACLLPILERHPEWWVGYCAYSTAGDIGESVWRYGVDFLAVEELLVTNRLVSLAREQHLPVYVWSVYDEEKMRQYLEMGVSGLISDYPDDAALATANYKAGHPDSVYAERKKESAPS